MLGKSQLGENIWKVIFPGRGKVKESSDYLRKFLKDIKSQERNKEFENKMVMAVFRKYTCT